MVRRTSAVVLLTCMQRAGYSGADMHIMATDVLRMITKVIEESLLDLRMSGEQRIAMS